MDTATRHPTFIAEHHTAIAAECASQFPGPGDISPEAVGTDSIRTERHAPDAGSLKNDPKEVRLCITH